MAARKHPPRGEELAGEEEPTSGARAFWSGTISFGLVSVPVDLYSGQRSTGTPLRMLGPGGTPLARRFYRRGTDQALDAEEIARGYELEDGRIVPLTDEELSSLLPEQSTDIDLRTFVDASSIDPRYFDRSYFLAPSGKSTVAYRLLATVMEQTGKVGIATFVMRGKQHVVAIAAEEGLLRAETLRFADELRSPEQLGLPEHQRPDAEAVKILRSIVGRLKAKDFPLSELEDEYGTRLEKLVQEKRKGHVDVVAPPAQSEVQQGAQIIDLMAVLRESLARGHGSAGAKPARPRRATSRSSKARQRKPPTSRR